MATDRAEILAHAQAHGSRAAAEHFGIPAATIRSWRARARRRAAQAHADQERAAERAPSPLASFEEQAARLVAWAEGGGCRRCGGRGVVPINDPASRERIPAVRAYRYSRVVHCPDCGGPQRTTVVIGTNLQIEQRAALADAEANEAAERRGQVGHREVQSSSVGQPRRRWRGRRR